MTPGTQPMIVNKVTKRTGPHPLSSTASGGRKIHRRVRPHPISRLTTSTPDSGFNYVPGSSPKVLWPSGKV